jgi:hypothetical protein
MKEPYREGVANHPDPESCVVSRKVGHEALTGAQVGWVLSREMEHLRGANAVRQSGKATRWKPLSRGPTTLRGQRPQTCLDPLCARTGRPRSRPSLENRRAGGGR